MQISWLGYNSYRFQSNGTTLITNPYDPVAEYKINRQGADIVVASHDVKEVFDAVSGNPFFITQPGEYEVKSIFVYGVPSASATLYRLTIESVSIAFIGSVKLKELTDAQLEVVEGADILIVPVGGGSVSNAKEAAQIINQIEPRIVIPSFYKISGSKGLDSIEVFLKEYSAPHEEVDKLRIQKKELLSEDTKVVIIKH